MSKGRSILLTVIVLLVLAGAGAIGWTMYRSSGMRLLGRAELALEVGQIDRALALANEYIQGHPDQWQGFFIKGRCLLAKGFLEEARAALEAAQQLNAGEVQIVLAVADTHSLQARKALSMPEAASNLPVLEKAVLDLRMAQDVLLGLKGTNPKQDLMIRRHVGLIWLRVALIQGMLAELLERQGDRAEANLDPHTAQAKRRRASAIRTEADQSRTQAVKVLMDVVRSDPAQDETAQELIQLCLSRSDRKSLEELRKVILASPTPPPVAANMLIVEDLRQQIPRSDPATRDRKLRRSCELLDELLKTHPNHPQVLSSRAAVALFMNDLDKVDQLCKDALQAQPAQPLARFLRAKVMALRGDLIGAEREFYRLATEAPRWAAVQYEYATLAAALGKRDLAQEAMRAVTQLESDHVEARRHMADLLLREGMYRQAFTDAEIAFRARNDDPQTLLVYVEACVRTNQKDRADAALADAALLQAAKPRMMLAVAEAYLLLEDEASSLNAARKGADLKPANELERVAVARCLSMVGKSSQAEKMFQDEVARDPRQPMMWAELGRLYTRTGRLIQAAEAYRRAARLEPGNTQHRLVLARVLLDLGDLEECERVLEQVHVHHPEANLLRMNVKLAQGQGQQAMQFFQQVYSTERSGLPLAVLQLSAGQIDACIQTCLAELANSPKDASLRQVLARAYVLAGRPAQAIEQHVAAVKLEPDRLHHYIALAGLLCGDMSAEQAAFKMASLPEARPELIDMSLGMVLARAGRSAQAAEHLARLITRKNVTDWVRGQARMLRAQCLARANQTEQAVIELSQLAREKPWARQARLAKVHLLIRIKNLDEARTTLTELQKQALDEQDVWLLQRVTAHYLSLHDDALTLQACDQLEKLIPYDASSFILRGYAHSLAGRKTDMIASYRQAIQRQPERLDTYLMLANLLDLHNEPQRVLGVLEELKACGPAGKAMALWGQANILDSWGLQSQAVKRLDELSAMGYGGDQAEYALARYYARLGQREPARKLLRQVAPRSRLYLAAQLLLIELSEDLQTRLDLLARLERERPANSAILIEKMRVLVHGGRDLDAAAAAEVHLARFRVVPQEAVLMAVDILVTRRQPHRAVELSGYLAQSSGSAYWRAVAMLLMLDEQLPRAEKLLVESDKASLVDALVGLCLGLQSGREEVAQRYLARLVKIDQDKPLPSLYRLPVLLLSGQEDKARAEAAALEQSVGADVVRDLVSHRGPGRSAELAWLLRASMLLDLGLNRHGATVAMMAFGARPSCLWAVALARRSHPGSPRLAEAADRIEPRDGEMGRTLQADRLMQEGKFSELAQLYARALQADNNNVGLQALHAWATSACGRHREALDLYRKVLDRVLVPAAANNAANLIATFFESDVALLNQARTWAEAAVAKAPENLAFRETSAWIAHLQGRSDQAARDLRQVVRGMPTSPTTHAHLGLAEIGAGRRDIARWHLQEAVLLGDMQPASQRGGELTRALELARQGLQALDTQAATRPAESRPASLPASRPAEAR